MLTRSKPCSGDGKLLIITLLAFSAVGCANLQTVQDNVDDKTTLSSTALEDNSAQSSTGKSGSTELTLIGPDYIPHDFDFQSQLAEVCRQD